MPTYIVKSTPQHYPTITYTVIAESGKNQAIEMFKKEVVRAHPSVNVELLQIDCSLN